MGFSHKGRRSASAGGPVRPVYDHADSFGEKPDYKTAALCKQARRAIAMTLAGECADEVLQSLMVDEVLPAPNAGRLLVRVVLRTNDPAVTLINVHERLAKVHGLLRASIGNAIVRKRTPELSFDVILLTPPPAIDPPGGAA
jgi:ribosome-binding factor A